MLKVIKMAKKHNAFNEKVISDVTAQYFLLDTRGELFNLKPPFAA